VTARNESGFTLLEVLVALAVLSIGAALILSLVSGALGNIRKVQLRTRSIQHAETVLEIALLDDSVKKPTVLRGDFEDGTRWSIQIQEQEMTPEQQGRFAPEQIDQFLKLPVRLFSYTVEVMAPDSTSPDFRLRTLKIVNIQDRLRPVGIQR
jgi:prepilin-type N-terminal cleavage/methylation domain-containing protein